MNSTWEDELLELGKKNGHNLSFYVPVVRQFLKQQREKYNTLAKAIEESQNIMAQWILPDSEISDAECLNKLLEVLDNQELVKFMRLNAPEPGGTNDN